MDYMNLKATIASVIGVTAVAGTLVFNTEIADKVADNIEALRTKIAAFAKNDEALVEKYNTLKDKAEVKIASLQKTIDELNAKLENNDDASTTEKAELEAEITRLTGELEKANAAVKDLETKSNAAVEEANTYKMTDPDTLPGLGEEEVVVDLATATANFKTDSTRVAVTLKEDIDLGLSNKGNISIKFTDNKGTTVTKSKIYAGFLNDSEGNKYGKGTNIPSNNYLNQLVAGNTYYTTLSVSNKPALSTIDAANIVKVEVTVTNNDGKVQVLKSIEKK
jgi:hypothetical protein